MRKLMVLVLVALMVSRGIGNAKDNKKVELKPPILHPPKETATEVGSEKNLFPIEIQQAGPEKKTTQAYFYEGQRLENFKQLKKVIDPLNDPEASRLLKSSANKESIGMVFNIASGLLVVGALIYTIAAPGTTTTSTAGPFMRTVTNVTPPDPAPSWFLGISGAFVGLIGLVLEGEAGQCRHDAVMRYNHLIESDQDLSMILLPHGDLPGLELTQRF